jgi:DNA-directed RNA polymerase specialized sigma24 family protein
MVCCNYNCKEGTFSATNPQQKQEDERILMKNVSRFDALVARYYPAVYDFAVKLTEDPRAAVELTRAAFRNAESQLPRTHGKTAIANLLISSVLRAGLQAA